MALAPLNCPPFPESRRFEARKRGYISSPLKASRAGETLRLAKDKANTSTQKTKQTSSRAAPSPLAAEFPSPGGTEARPAGAATGTTKPRWRPSTAGVKLHLPSRPAARANGNGSGAHGRWGQDYNSRGVPRRGAVLVDSGRERPPHLRWRRRRGRAERVPGRRTRAGPSSPHCPVLWLCPRAGSAGPRRGEPGAVSLVAGRSLAGAGGARWRHPLR